MDPAIHGNRPIKSVQQQETVQPERRLLMKLKGNPAELKAAKAELQAKKAELNRVEQDAEMQMSKLVESSFLQSQLPANQLSESDMFFSHIDPDELEQQDQVAEIQYQALTDMQKIGRQEEEVDVEIMKNQAETTHAEEVTLWDHATDIIGMEGTTLVSALATLGAGAAAVLTAPAIIGVTLAVAATGVATNEAVKMFNRHLSHTGSKEHGKVIQQAVERAEGKTQEAKAANAIVIKNLDECTEKIGNAEKILANLAQQMKGTTGELRQHYEGLIKLHEDVKDTQIKKKKHLLEANTNSEEALKILRGQEKLLRALQKMELPKSITEDSLKQFMTELKTQIINIRAEGDKAHDATLKSLQAMGTALQVSDAPIYDQINQLTAQTALLINRAEQAEGQVGQLQKENTDLKNINADTKEKAKITDNKLEDVETDLKIAKRANELRQEEFQFGGGSALYGIGVGGAMTIGSAFLLGPASLAFVASASLGTMGSAAVAHYVRAMKRANAHLAEKKQILG